MAVSKKNFRSTPLSVEQLEARMLMTVNSIEEALDSLELVGAAAKAKNVAPSISKSITVSGGNTVNGTSANLSVLGKDDKSESLLTYSWSVVSTPAGGKASLSASGNNGAKNTKVTFTKPGSYELRVTIADKDGGSVKASQKVTVKQAAQVASLTISSNGSSIASGSTLQSEGTSVSLNSSLAAGWTQNSAPSGGASSIAASGTNATISFTKAGLYTFSAVSGSSTINFSVNVNQKLTSITVTPGTQTLNPGATQQFTASGKDQFNASMSFTPTWTTTSGSINSSGVLTAPGSAGTLTVKAASGQAQGTATITVASQSSIQNANIASLVSSLFADGSLNRTDVMQILRSTGSDGTVDATELGDLRYIVSNASAYAMPGYVQILAGNVVNTNAANATYLGIAAGNLTAGSGNTLLSNLVDKWFMGTDLPTITGGGISYKAATGPLFVGGSPSFNDQLQGQLGDCYFISTVAALANRNPTAVANMFLDNGDGTYTVRFYSGSYSMWYRPDGSISDGFVGEVGTADYVTVNRQLPAYSNNTFAYSNYGKSITSSTTALWIALAEKAYAQWNQTGKSGRNGTNTYAGIEGGWMGTVNAQVLGVNASSYILASASAQTLINVLAAGNAVTIGTKSGASNGLVGSHAYTVKSYDAATQTFALHNPWGMMHPGGLTWAQLQANCTWFSVANATSSPIAATRVTASQPTMRGEVPAEYFAPFQVAAEYGMETEEPVADQMAPVTNEHASGLALQQRAAATDYLLALETDFEPTRTITAEAVDQLFDHLEKLLE